jgi:methyl-accepting chemotaxis protein
MKIKTKLLCTLIGIGVVPVCAMGIASYIVTKSASAKVGRHAKESLGKVAEETISVVNEVKKAQVIDYFENAAKQVTALVQDSQSQSRFKSLRDGFYRFDEDRKVVLDAPADDRNKLEGFYRNEFAKAYKTQNQGKAPDVDIVINNLSPGGLALQNAFIASNPHPLGSKFKLISSSCGSNYDAAHKQYTDFITEFKFYDLFFVDSQTGDVIYSVFKEADFATNLINGLFAKSALGNAFRKANEATKDSGAVVADFESYFPSYGIPVSFIAKPFFDGEKRLGVAILQLSSIESLNKVMSLGNNTKAYLVGQDFLPRSDSKLDPKNRSIINAFKNPENGRIQKVAVERALKGESGVIHDKNYLNQPTYTSYSPIDILGSHWAMIVD